MGPALQGSKLIDFFVLYIFMYDKLGRRVVMQGNRIRFWIGAQSIILNIFFVMKLLIYCNTLAYSPEAKYCVVNSATYCLICSFPPWTLIYF